MLRETILECLEQKAMGNLKVLLAGAEDMEILHAFIGLSPQDQVIAFRLLSKEDALSVFEQLDTGLQQNLLHSFTDERVKEFVDRLAPDDRVKLLDELPTVVANKLIESLSPEERAVTNILMGYEPETAGHIMTTEFISLQRDMTAEQALAKVRRQAREKETIYTLFVTDSTGRLEGVLSLQGLLMADGDSPVEDAMSQKPISVTTDTDQEKVARTLQELDLLAIPVVDRDDRLVGIVTIDDAVDILRDEATEDIFNHAGLADVTDNDTDRSAVLISGSIWKIWKVRLPFLFITLVASLLAGVVVGGFEEALKAVASAAIFIPLIMDMGGNVGTQSAVVLVRAMALGHLPPGAFLRQLLKEVGIGFSLGAIIGSTAGVIAFLWRGIPLLGVAVAVALTISMTMMAVVGFLIPFILIKLKGDEAAGSGPMVTSINDIAGLLIYFVSVTVFMGHTW